MERVDKLFAGLAIIVLLVFWVIISPETITQRTVEAKPVETSAPQPREIRVTAPKPRRTAARPPYVPPPVYPEPTAAQQRTDRPANASGTPRPKMY